MPQVAVQINGKTYRMACDEGQEAHLLDLAERFDKSIHQLKGSFGEIGDQRLTVMAGVMVTDELVELQQKVAALENQISKLKEGSVDDSALSETLAKTAERIEAMAGKLKAVV